MAFEVSDLPGQPLLCCNRTLADHCVAFVPLVDRLFTSCTVVQEVDPFAAFRQNTATPLIFLLQNPGWVLWVGLCITWRVLGVGAAAILLSAALGSWASRRALTPLGEVRLAAESLAAGELDTRLDPPADADLASLTASFNGMARSLEDRIERDARFASEVSHELRSPLMTLNASVEVLNNNRDGMTERNQTALDLLTDDSVGIVSLGGRAGTGKSVLALAAALEAVLENRTHSKVIVFRPLYAVGGQDIGYLPGSEAEKMSPWAAAVTDALEAIAGPEVVDEIIHRDLLEIMPLTHIRGRSITDAFIIVDEAQNLERNVLLTALTRIGENSKVVLTHDVAQRDNLRVGRYDGIGAVVDHLRGHPLFGHITLTRSERSPVAALVAGLLDGHG